MKRERSSKFFRVGLAAFLFLISVFLYFSDLNGNFYRCDKIWQLLDSVAPKTLLTKTQTRQNNVHILIFPSDFFLQSFPLLQVFKMGVLKNFTRLTGKTVSFVIKLQDASSFFKNETHAQMFPCEFFRISKNIFLYRTPWNNCFSTAIVRWLNFHTIEIIIKQILTEQYLKNLTRLQLCSSVFLVYYEHIFVYCDAFFLKKFFLMSLLSIFNRFSYFGLLFLTSVLKIY